MRSITRAGRRPIALAAGLLLVAISAAPALACGGLIGPNGAVNLLRTGVDIATIALWLGHSDIRATQIYLHADLAIKERALLRTTPPNIAPGRYRPPDPLLAFLEAL